MSDGYKVIESGRLDKAPLVVSLSGVTLGIVLELKEGYVAEDFYGEDVFSSVEDAAAWLASRSPLA